MIKNEIFDFETKSIKFKSRPLTLGANYRLSWKCAFIVLLIGRIAGKNSTSLKRLSVFNWTLQKESNYWILDEIILNESRIAAASIKYESGLSRTLMYLIAIKILSLKNGKYSLSGLGMELFQQLRDEKKIFQREKECLNKFSVRQLSEKKISTILNGG